MIRTPGIVTRVIVSGTMLNRYPLQTVLECSIKEGTDMSRGAVDFVGMPEACATSNRCGRCPVEKRTSHAAASHGLVQAGRHFVPENDASTFLRNASTKSVNAGDC